MKAYIYGLVDPTDMQIRYIGQSRNCEQRYKEHIGEGATDGHSIKSRWIGWLLYQGITPKLQIIEETTSLAVDDREVWWIRSFADRGHKLYNTKFNPEFNQMPKPPRKIMVYIRRLHLEVPGITRKDEKIIRVLCKLNMIPHVNRSGNFSILIDDIDQVLAVVGQAKQATNLT